MSTYTAGQSVSKDAFQVGFRFMGSNGVEYTVTDISRVTWDDAPISMVYVTVTDGKNDYTVEEEELIKHRVAH